MAAGGADVRSLATRLADRIRRDGPISVADYVDAALYDQTGGFYMTGGRAGRSGDFLTAPEVGWLFGAVLARAIDSWWVEMGSPEELLVVDLGAGPGTLGRSVLDAEPRASRSGALTWASWEHSAIQRRRHPETDGAQSPDRMPSLDGPTIVLANELLDNCPFEMLERTPGGWIEVLVGVDVGGGFATVPGGPRDDHGLPGTVEMGARVPLQLAARELVDQLVAAMPSGRVVVLDYGAPTEELAGRPDLGWLRTHRRHDDRGDWLVDPGSRDITADVAVDQITADHAAARISTQADFLRAHGIEELVAEGKRVWQERAHIGDLDALKGRSRVSEAEALLDPDGMGGFFVAEWTV